MVTVNDVDMKRLFTLLALMPILFCSCASFEDNDVILAFGAPTELTAGFDDDTRTYVEDGKYLRWHEDDRITAFYGNTLNRQYKFKGKTGDNSGTFALVPSGELGTGNELEAIYAVYPYDENATITDAGVISLTLPATQSYAENSFGKGANTMVAVTENIEDTFLAFKNACGYLKLKLYNADGASLKSLTVKGNNDEKIAGNATATIEFGGVPTIVMSNDATTTVTLDCGDGIALGTSVEEATALWIVLPETTFEGGITITATDTEGGVFEKSTTNEVVIERNAIQPMVALEANFTPTYPANNEIWYKSTNGWIGYDPSAFIYLFGSTGVSDNYNTSIKWRVVTCQGDITMIDQGTFCNNTYLQSMILPNSLQTIGNDAFTNCSNLYSITFGSGIKSIGESAFFGCDFYTVKIPANITTIGSSAFSNCISMEYVYFESNTPPTCGDEIFYNTRALRKIYVPASEDDSIINAYKAVPELETYASKIYEY